MSNEELVAAIQAGAADRMVELWGADGWAVLLEGQGTLLSGILATQRNHRKAAKTFRPDSRIRHRTNLPGATIAAAPGLAIDFWEKVGYSVGGATAPR
ncbi:MAG: hypothetical protein MR636_08915 [Clostridiales bacterium]|nr:hypothetical protein [Clostridiales bacterium]